MADNRCSSDVRRGHQSQLIDCSVHLQQVEAKSLVIIFFRDLVMEILKERCSWARHLYELTRCC
jgi:hypothetical protein